MGSNKKNGMDHAVDAQITASQRVEGEYSWFPLMRISRARVNKPLDRGEKQRANLMKEPDSGRPRLYLKFCCFFFVSRFVSEFSFLFLVKARYTPYGNILATSALHALERQKVIDVKSFDQCFVCLFF
jgi:hypothetical protein